jgi:hypothetical protein
MPGIKALAEGARVNHWLRRQKKAGPERFKSPMFPSEGDVYLDVVLHLGRSPGIRSISEVARGIGGIDEKRLRKVIAEGNRKFPRLICISSKGEVELTGVGKGYFRIHEHPSLQIPVDVTPELLEAASAFEKGRMRKNHIQCLKKYKAIELSAREGDRRGLALKPQFIGKLNAVRYILYGKATYVKEKKPKDFLKSIVKHLEGADSLGISEIQRRLVDDSAETGTGGINGILTGTDIMRYVRKLEGQKVVQVSPDGGVSLVRTKAETAVQKPELMTEGKAAFEKVTSKFGYMATKLLERTLQIELPEKIPVDRSLGKRTEMLLEQIAGNRDAISKVAEISGLPFESVRNLTAWASPSKTTNMVVDREKVNAAVERIAKEERQREELAEKRLKEWLSKRFSTKLKGAKEKAERFQVFLGPRLEEAAREMERQRIETRKREAREALKIMDAARKEALGLQRTKALPPPSEEAVLASRFDNMAEGLKPKVAKIMSRTKKRGEVIEELGKVLPTQLHEAIKTISNLRGAGILGKEHTQSELERFYPFSKTVLPMLESLNLVKVYGPEEKIYLWDEEVPKEKTALKGQKPTNPTLETPAVIELPAAPEILLLPQPTKKRKKMAYGKKRPPRAAKTTRIRGKEPISLNERIARAFYKRDMRFASSVLEATGVASEMRRLIAGGVKYPSVLDLGSTLEKLKKETHTGTKTIPKLIEEEKAADIVEVGRTGLKFRMLRPERLEPYKDVLDSIGRSHIYMLEEIASRSDPRGNRTAKLRTTGAYNYAGFLEDKGLIKKDHTGYHVAERGLAFLGDFLRAFSNVPTSEYVKAISMRKPRFVRSPEVSAPSTYKPKKGVNTTPGKTGAKEEKRKRILREKVAPVLEKGLSPEETITKLKNILGDAYYKALIMIFKLKEEGLLSAGFSPSDVYEYHGLSRDIIHRLRQAGILKLGPDNKNYLWYEKPKAPSENQIKSRVKKGKSTYKPPKIEPPSTPAEESAVEKLADSFAVPITEISKSTGVPVNRLRELCRLKRHNNLAVWENPYGEPLDLVFAAKFTKKGKHKREYGGAIMSSKTGSLSHEWFGRFMEMALKRFDGDEKKALSFICSGIIEMQRRGALQREVPKAVIWRVTNWFKDDFFKGRKTYISPVTLRKIVKGVAKMGYIITGLEEDFFGKETLTGTEGAPSCTVWRLQEHIYEASERKISALKGRTSVPIDFVRYLAQKTHYDLGEIGKELRKEGYTPDMNYLPEALEMMKTAEESKEWIPLTTRHLLLE